MKRLFIAGLIFIQFSCGLKSDWNLPDQFSLKDLRKNFDDFITSVKRAIAKRTSNFKAQDTLVLKNGSMIQGVIQSEDERQVTLQIPDGTVGFARSDIAEIRRGQTIVAEGDGIHAKLKPTEADLPYPRIFLKDGQIAYGGKILKEKDQFYLQKPVEGGGTASFGFAFDQIERIALWPFPSQEVLDKDFKRLSQENTRHSFLKPPYYIVSSVESSDLVLYFKALQQYYDEFLLNFFDLIDPERSPGPLPVVIFSDYKQFLKTAGLSPSTQIVGFYAPKNKILFLYNLKETEMVRFQLRLAEYYQKNIGGAMTEIEFYSGNAEGKWQAYDFFEKIRNELDRRKTNLEAWARSRTIEVIRHEASHQLLHLFGIDSSEVYRGGWFSEGFAEYMSPENMGSLNQDRLMFLRAEIDAGRSLMPLQFLMNIPSGQGIHRLGDQDYRLLAYAQSWAFVYFLMQKYQSAFFSYIRELKEKSRDFNAEKDIALLEQHVGKKLPEIEREFEPFAKDLMIKKLNPEVYEFYRLIQRQAQR